MNVFTRATVFLSLIMFSALPAMSETAHDGEYYFEQMRISMLETLTENQKLINTGQDGAPKTEKLKPEAVYTGAYEIFEKNVGKDFKLSQIKGETDVKKIAPVLAELLQAGRIAIARAQKDINREADGSVKLKKFIPAVFGSLVIRRFTEKTGILMKQTTLGRGAYHVRNPENAPDEWETAALKKFMASGWEPNKGIGVSEGNKYRYAKPIYIKKGCLACHGVPVGEKGPYGHPKEGYKVGEIRGCISVTLPK
ncbi:MAG: hypothetical protein DRI57_03005 [Deltaproteobacteria bacterium]|nr:MAG: hypothetical protein DRI57_03005 [Deltaproteobacteria bacterium]